LHPPGQARSEELKFGYYFAVVACQWLALIRDKPDGSGAFIFESKAAQAKTVATPTF